MAWNKKAKVLVAVALLVVSSGAMAAKGKLGFGMQYKASGFVSPVLTQLKVTTVIAGSPAALAGVKPGDYIVEFDGQHIDGAPARAMAGQFKSLQPGQHVHLELKRGNAFVNVEIVAGT